MSISFQTKTLQWISGLVEYIATSFNKNCCYMVKLHNHVMV